MEEEEDRGRRLTAETTVYCAAHCPMGGLLSESSQRLGGLQPPLGIALNTGAPLHVDQIYFI